MTTPSPEGSAPSGSRDRRIEEPTNLWLVHPLGRALLRPAIRAGISANAVSCAGLAAGAGAAMAFAQWRSPAWVAVGAVLATAWLVLDGLDGMVARATGTASPLGRLMDGLCDHGAFVLMYVGLALSVGTAGGWALAVAAGVAHAVQSSLYEGERARFHRRLRREAPPAAPALSPAAGLVAFYDRVAGLPSRGRDAFEAALAGPAGGPLAAEYGRRAARPMRLMMLLSANTRVQLIVLACFAGRPTLFWWAELTVLPAVAAVGLAWHRRVAAALSPLPAASRGLSPQG